MKPWMFVAGWLLLMAIVCPLVFRMAMGQGFPGGPAPAERGARLRAWSPGGRASLNFSRGMLALTVYERGLLIKPVFGRATWIDRDAIRAIAAGTGLFTQGTRVQLEGADFLLWNTASEHDWLLAWWRGRASAQAA